MNSQPRLLDVPVAGVYPCDLRDANAFLERVGHKLGPVARSFRSEAWQLEIDGQTVAVAVSCSTVSAHVVDDERHERRVWRRGELVELARIAAANPAFTRVMLRIWREALAPRWECWPVAAAVSYSKNAMHTGDLYRFDGWRKVRDNAGSSGGGTWSRSRDPDDPRLGRKTLWLWEYAS